MWLYCWPHCAYHTARLYARSDRWRIRLTVVLLSLLPLLAIVIVLDRPKSTNFCNEDLVMTATYLALACMLNFMFSFAFVMMEPVTTCVKTLFHIYGAASLLFHAWIVLIVLNTDKCDETTPELYYLLFASSVVALICTVIILVLLPFWLLNRVKPGSVLDVKGKTGICYEPVKTCPCVWHV